jgi:hypothetical protein
MSFLIVSNLSKVWTFIIRSIQSYSVIDGWRECSIERLEPFFSITSDTEIPLSLQDQCRSCIRNAISRYTESGLQLFRVFH